MITNYHMACIPDFEDPPYWGDPRCAGLTDAEIWAWAAQAERNNALRERMLAELRASAPPVTLDPDDPPANPAYDE